MPFNNIPSSQKVIALHLASASVSLHSIMLLLDRRTSVDVTDTDDSTTLHVSAGCENLEETKAFVERGAALNGAKI